MERTIERLSTNASGHEPDRACSILVLTGNTCVALPRGGPGPPWLRLGRSAPRCALPDAGQCSAVGGVCRLCRVDELFLALGNA